METTMAMRIDATVDISAIVSENARESVKLLLVNIST
jgi:hypothetical protein